MRVIIVVVLYGYLERVTRPIDTKFSVSPI